jgi:hypothetical protein
MTANQADERRRVGWSGIVTLGLLADNSTLHARAQAST